MKETMPRRELIKTALLGALPAISLPQVVNTQISFLNKENDDVRDFTVLFQGDSITDGNRSRNLDWNHVMGHGYAYLISSRLWCEHPAKGLHFFNRGVSGNKITDLAARWQADTIAIKPDLLSILVGVNDVDSMFSADRSAAISAQQYEDTYRNLLSATKKELPSVRIVICEPFILPVGKVKDNWTVWSAEMKSRQEIVKKLAKESKAIHVPLQEVFDNACKGAPADYWIWDGIHPMPAGHELIARQWIKKVKSAFPISTGIA